MPVQFQLVDFSNEFPALVPIDDAEYRRAMANARPRCRCGRFAKPGTPEQMDMNGEYWYTVHCTTCGEVRIC